jgi:hypothetical protein
VGLERGPHSLLSKIEELLDRKVAVPVSKIEITAVFSLSILYSLSISLSAKVGTKFDDKERRLLAIVLSRTQATEVAILLLIALPSRSLGGDVCSFRRLHESLR